MFDDCSYSTIRSFSLQWLTHQHLLIIENMKIVIQLLDHPVYDNFRIDTFWLSGICHENSYSVSLCSCVPVFLYSCVPVFLCSCVPVFLRSCVPAFLRSCVPAFLRPCVPTFLRSCIPVFLRSCVPAFLVIISYNYPVDYASTLLSACLWLEASSRFVGRIYASIYAYVDEVLLNIPRSHIRAFWVLVAFEYELSRFYLYPSIAHPCFQGASSV